MRPLRLTFAAVALLIGACSQPAEPVATTAATTAAASQIDIGRALYETACAVCHGGNLRGTSMGPSFLSPFYEPGHHGDGAFVVAVTRGSPQHHWDFGPMPPVAGLSLDDIAAITAYVRSVQETEGFDG